MNQQVDGERSRVSLVPRTLSFFCVEVGKESGLGTRLVSRGQTALLCVVFPIHTQ